MKQPTTIKKPKKVKKTFNISQEILNKLNEIKVYSNKTFDNLVEEMIESQHIRIAEKLNVDTAKNLEKDFLEVNLKVHQMNFEIAETNNELKILREKLEQQDKNKDFLINLFSKMTNELKENFDEKIKEIPFEEIGKISARVERHSNRITEIKNSLKTESEKTIISKMLGK